MSSPLPRPLGLYLLLHRLGQGGMGDVFLAKQAGLEGVEQYCVVKAIRADRTAEASVVGRFIDEAALSVHLNHKNICQVFRVGRGSGDLFVAMELIAGRTLAEILTPMLRNRQRLPEPVALHIATEMLSALDYAHRLVHPVTGAPMQVVHRDVSPQNVMVSFEGEVKLIDFGLAASTVKKEKTAGGVKIGKVAYMAPEQVLDQPVAAATDQYAAAVLTYELLTSRRFYSGVSSNELLRAVAEGGYVPALWKELHPGLQTTLQRALQRDPAARFATCGAFRRALVGHMKAHSLLADSDDVRELLADLFPDGPSTQRTLLQQFAHLTPPPPDGVEDSFEELSSQSHLVSPALTEVLLTNPEAAVPSGEPTPGKPAPVGADEHPGPPDSPVADLGADGVDAGDADADADADSDTDSEPAAGPPPGGNSDRPMQGEVRVAKVTEAMGLASGPGLSRSVIILAGVALGLVVIIFGLLALNWSALKAAPVAAVDEVGGEAVSTEKPIGDREHADDSSPSPDAPPPPPEDDGDETAPAPAPDPTASAQAKPDDDRAEPETRSRKARKLRRRARARKDRKAAAATVRRPPPTRNPKGNKEKQDVLKWCRGHEPCAQQTLSRLTRVAKLPPEQIRGFFAEIDACVARCLR